MGVRYCYYCYYLAFLFRRDIKSYVIFVFLAKFSSHFTPINLWERDWVVAIYSTDAIPGYEPLSSLQYHITVLVQFTPTVKATDEDSKLWSFSVREFFGFIYSRFYVTYTYLLSWSGVHKFSKNSGTISAFLAPGWWYEPSSVLRTEKNNLCHCKIFNRHGDWRPAICTPLDTILASSAKIVNCFSLKMEAPRRLDTSETACPTRHKSEHSIFQSLSKTAILYILVEISCISWQGR